TKAALESLGITVEHLRWWDGSQRGDLIHFFGRPSGQYVDLAHGKGMRVVISDLLTGAAARSAGALAAQRFAIVVAKRVLPHSFCARMNWESFVKADAVIALTSWEAELVQRLFRAPARRVHIVPNGVAREFLGSSDEQIAREDYLVCTATIAERKRALELARAAVRAGTPLWIIGRAYDEGDPYARRFSAFAREHRDVVRYEGAVEDRQLLAQIYAEARGFVLLSTMESLSLSALEAAACGCPLLLSDLPWARTTFDTAARYCPIAGPAVTAPILRAFYDAAPGLPRPPRPASWEDVARKLTSIYEEVRNTSS